MSPNSVRMRFVACLSLLAAAVCAPTAALTRDDAWTALPSHVAPLRLVAMAEGSYFAAIPLPEGGNPLKTLADSGEWTVFTHGDVVVLRRTLSQPCPLEVTDDELRRLLDLPPALRNPWAKKFLPETIGDLTQTFSPRQRELFQTDALSCRDLSPTQREILNGAVLQIGFGTVLRAHSELRQIERALREPEQEISWRDTSAGERWFVLKDPLSERTQPLGRHRPAPESPRQSPLRESVTRQIAVDGVEGPILSPLVAERTLTVFGDRPPAAETIAAFNALFDTYTEIREDPSTGAKRTRFLAKSKPPRGEGFLGDALAQIPEMYLRMFAARAAQSRRTDDPVPEDIRRRHAIRTDRLAFHNACGQVLHWEIERLARAKTGKDRTVRVADLSRAQRNLLNAYVAGELVEALYEAATTPGGLVIRHRDDLYLSGGSTTLDGRAATGFLLSIRQEDGTLFPVAGNRSLR